MSRKRRQLKADPQVTVGLPVNKRHPMHETFVACREAGEGLYGLLEDGWKNEICRPNVFVGMFRLLRAMVSVPWTDHGFPATMSSGTSRSPETRKRAHRK